MSEFPLKLTLTGGWHGPLAHLREDPSPLVLVSVADGSDAKHYFRVDIGKRMAVDALPKGISQDLLAQIVEQLGRKLRGDLVLGP